MPSKSRKAEKDGGPKKKLKTADSGGRKSPVPAGRKSPVPPQASSTKKSSKADSRNSSPVPPVPSSVSKKTKTESRAIRSMEKDSLATATVPKKGKTSKAAVDPKAMNINDKKKQPLESNNIALKASNDSKPKPQTSQLTSLETAATPARAQQSTPGKTKAGKPKSMSKSQGPGTLSGKFDRDEKVESKLENEASLSMTSTPSGANDNNKVSGTDSTTLLLRASKRLVQNKIIPKQQHQRNNP